MDFLSVLCQFAIVEQVYTRGCEHIELGVLGVFVRKEACGRLSEPMHFQRYAEFSCFGDLLFSRVFQSPVSRHFLQKFYVTSLLMAPYG